MSKSHFEAKEIEIFAATTRHLQGMACLHRMCFSSQFEQQMGQNYLLSAYRPYITDSSGIAIVAVDSHENIVGFVTGGSRNIERQFVKTIPKKFVFQLSFGFLFNKVVREVIITRLLDAFRSRANGNWRRSDAVLPPGTAWLYVICVHPEARASAVATRLIEAFISECATRGYTRAALRVSQRNGRAIRCYEKNGWRIFSSERDSFQMVFELAPISVQNQMEGVAGHKSEM